MIRGRFDHVGFTVSDMSRSVEWYEHLLRHAPLVRSRWDKPYLGTMVGYSGCDIEFAHFPLPGGGELELIQYIEPAPGKIDSETYNVGNGHLCLLVDDVHEEFERLHGRAAFRSSEPVAIPFGQNAGGFGLYLRDPDGITIELIERRSGKRA